MQEAQWFRDTFDAVRSEVQKAIVGQHDIVEGVLIGLAASGHVLLEGMPGLGKTLLVRSLSRALSLDFSRIQFTPDMMPADVTGTNVLNEGRTFEFRRGPVFANIVLADEINRATPKTQSAMLEAMQERSVTVGGRRHELTEPFLVMATQNPVEQEGTYPLPEAQLDRFFFKLIVPYPTKADLAEVVARTTGEAYAEPQAVASKEDILRMRALVRQVPIANNVLDYGLSLVVATHPEGEGASPVAGRYCRYGASPRGAQSLITAGKVHALLAGRFNVSKEDLKKALKPVLRHRIILNFEAEADGMTADKILDEVGSFVDSRDRDPIKV
ncbi:AAA family ATPase [Fimbriimonas ginsengisoli]|uniref:MoxR-like ATPase in aerotolerance operon n=1 Tax=Fimbriimonas ginsengisoli Gsoil 348 TaxID=661478 RepID=A0A068NKB0_FIMGI|nr:MoxR family ATPase [Fimbriimonas ginsengisoli]AIE83931.1 MoxR-like ATPase in aerotolerance operon [Fimbriimonas ginsengisoli Gsoil 348]